MKIIKKSKTGTKNQKIKTKYFRKYGNILCAKNLDTVSHTLYNEDIFRFRVIEVKRGKFFDKRGNLSVCKRAIWNNTGASLEAGS